MEVVAKFVIEDVTHDKVLHQWHPQKRLGDVGHHAIDNQLHPGPLTSVRGMVAADRRPASIPPRTALTVATHRTRRVRQHDGRQTVRVCAG